MRIIFALLALSALIGCAPKYSPEERRERVDMIKRGLDPDTGEPRAEAQRRKEQAAANFSAGLQRDLSNLSVNQRQQRAAVEAASRGSSVAADRAKAERNARYAAVVAERPSHSDSSARHRAMESERKADAAKREEATVATRKQEQAARARGKEKSTEKAQVGRVKHEDSASTSGAWLTSVNNSDRNSKTPEEVAAQQKREADRKKSEEAAAAAAEREKAKKVAAAKASDDADRKICMKPENRGNCGCLKYFPVDPTRKVCGK